EGGPLPQLRGHVVCRIQQGEPGGEPPHACDARAPCAIGSAPFHDGDHQLRVAVPLHLGHGGLDTPAVGLAQKMHLEAFHLSARHQEPEAPPPPNPPPPPEKPPPPPERPPKPPPSPPPMKPPPKYARRRPRLPKRDPKKGSPKTSSMKSRCSREPPPDRRPPSGRAGGAVSGNSKPSPEAARINTPIARLIPAANSPCRKAGPSTSRMTRADCASVMRPSRP